MTERELIEHMVRNSSKLSQDEQDDILRGDLVEVALPDNYKMDFKNAVRQNRNLKSSRIDSVDYLYRTLWR